MNELTVWYSIGAVVIVVVAYFAFEIFKFLKLPEEERREKIIVYLQGVVSMAEQKIGGGNGKEKLAEAENYFKKNAPVAYKMALSVLKVGSLDELVEEALTRAKEAFVHRNDE